MDALWNMKLNIRHVSTKDIVIDILQKTSKTQAWTLQRRTE